MKKKIIGLIPVRLKSKRLPRKALLDLEGLPMIVHTFKRSKLSKKLDDLYVCTDSKEIIEVCNKFDIKYIKTSSKHKNGTERIAEAAKKLKNVFLIVDIQGDEPLIKPSDIDKVINFHLKNLEYDIIVPYQKINKSLNNNLVKIASSNNKVLFFSRNNIPFEYKKKILFLKKHYSIISFKVKSLIEFSKLSESELEKIEGIELMRAVENDFKIGTFSIKSKAFAVDVIEDYFKAKKFFKSDSLLKSYFK